MHTLVCWVYECMSVYIRLAVNALHCSKYTSMKFQTIFVRVNHHTHVHTFSHAHVFQLLRKTCFNVVCMCEPMTIYIIWRTTGLDSHCLDCKNIIANTVIQWSVSLPICTNLLYILNIIMCSVLSNLPSFKQCPKFFCAVC